MKGNDDRMKEQPEKIRIDKWLWAMRLFKTRSTASETCEKGKVRMCGLPVKASRNIKAGDIISIRKGAFTLQFQVLQLTENRQPAKFVAEYCKDLTPADELERIKIHAVEIRAFRKGGEGRPTKRDRRELDEFIF